MVDVRRSINRASPAGAGNITSIVTRVKFFAFGYGNFFHAAHLMAFQGMDPSKLTFPPLIDYVRGNMLAGNAMSAPVLGAFVFGALAFILPGPDGTTALLRPTALRRPPPGQRAAISTDGSGSSEEETVDSSL